MNLKGLDPLNSLQPLSNDTLSALGQATGADLAKNPAPTKCSITDISCWVNQFGGKFILIALGLLLIAAGVFSFDKTREIVTQAGKAAAVAA